ncbi:hypothetical protein ABEF95_016019 [Exophiala dermatitidis]
MKNQTETETERSRYRLDRDRHIKYWKRCAQLLPEPYTSGDSNRMSFGFFIVAALDLLGALENETVVSTDERRGWIEWIYGCQVPHTGGFRGFTGTVFGAMRTPQNWHWDPANLPNTYFALATLVILGDDLSRVKVDECRNWVRGLQRPNGSFGEFLGGEGEVLGGDDPRLCLCAVGTLRILELVRRRRKEEEGDERKEEKEGLVGIDEEGLQRLIGNCQSHEGGIGQAPLLEAHSGLNYCGIATLSFVGMMQNPPASIQEMASQAGLDIESCVRWMLDRQTTWIDDDDEDEDEDDEEDNVEDDHQDQKGDEDDKEKRHNGQADGRRPDERILDLSSLKPGLTDNNNQELTAGFCGRCGKMADTCYCFWNVGALAILQQHQLVNVDALRRYLLGHVAHLVGGFGKAPGELPDLLHSYLGLATLALYDESGLKEFDPTFCFSKDAVEKLKRH